MTRGSEKLRDTGRSQTDIATALGVTQQAVQWWMSGRSVPTTRHAVRMEKLYGIRPEDWFRPSRRRGAA